MSTIIYPLTRYVEPDRRTFQVVFMHVQEHRLGSDTPVGMMEVLRAPLVDVAKNVGALQSGEAISIAIDKSVMDVFGTEAVWKTGSLGRRDLCTFPIRYRETGVVVLKDGDKRKYTVDVFEVA